MKSVVNLPNFGTNVLQHKVALASLVHTMKSWWVKRLRHRRDDLVVDLVALVPAHQLSLPVC